MRSMTDELFRTNAPLAMCDAQVVAVTPQGVVLDRTVFYPLGGGQAGDSGVLLMEGGDELAIADTRKEKDDTGAATGRIVHIPAPGQEALLARLQAGDTIAARIDWARRHRLMRLHSATHLLCHLVPELVNGCSITPDYARMDFAMTAPLEVGAITDAELDANPALVKSMSVQPPRGTGRIRIIRIGAADGGEPIDLQPCGGTHVANTAEIGAIVVTKIEKKSASTRRVVLGFAE